jgi:methylamine dehydrogenase light chain
MMSSLDDGIAALSRRLAMRSSRRGVLSRMGKIMLGAAASTPLLPVDRRFGQARANELQMDATQCDYWKYCSMDGQLCSCCGGSASECPPGTEISKVSWVGTCRNGNDGQDYLVSYTDCCGRSSCGQCDCHGNVRERPGYSMGVHNDVNWCMANKNVAYHCTISVIVGMADQ